jgi:probable phosphoglycerate mutase
VTQVPGSPGGAATSGAAAPAEAPRYLDQSIRLVLWRHGQTRWNVEGRFQGQSDIPLDAVGEQQAERAARLLAGLRPDAIVSSDLSRATATTAPLARLTGLTVTIDKDLRERFGGLWEGLTDAEIRARFPDEHAAWLPPEGESSAVVADRAGAALERIAAGMAPGTLVVVVSHGAAIRLGAARLLGFPEELWGAVGPLANCAWSVLGRRRSRWRLLEHNAGTLPEPVLSDDR